MLPSSVLEEEFRRESLRILTYSVMPDHWHLVVWPQDGRSRQVSVFPRWLTATLTRPPSHIEDGAGSGLSDRHNRTGYCNQLYLYIIYIIYIFWKYNEYRWTIFLSS